MAAEPRLRRLPLTHRIELRGAGEGWPQPGDPLKGRPREFLAAAVQAVADAAALREGGVGDLTVDTSAHGG